MSDYYGEDDYTPNSPRLQVFKPKATPSPSPPPFIPPQVTISSPENVSPTSSKKRRRSNKRKIRPSQGDAVLISNLDPNRPDIARACAVSPLPGSDSEPEGSGDESVDMTNDVDATTADNASQSSPNAASTAAAALAIIEDPVPVSKGDSTALIRKAGQSGLRDGERRDMSPPGKPTLDRAFAIIPNQKLPLNGIVTNEERRDSMKPPNAINDGDAAAGISSRARSSSGANGMPEDSLAKSPSIGKHVQSTGSPSQTLPALQNVSPKQDTQLPSFAKLAAEVDAAENQKDPRVNGFHPPHRQSFSSTGGPPGQSPPLVAHYPNGASRSPPSQFPPLQTSPISAHSELSRDTFSSTTRSPPSATGFPTPGGAFWSTRRQSQASDHGPTFSASTSPNEAYSPGKPASSDPHRMSIDGAVRPELPPPNPPAQHLSSHGSGQYRCEHPGCTAPPFQTQYLLNSHANVHSQNRPHYCPVPGCPRGEGGKGFKRKNEMIRHGLVHDSPGYVCPFCPEREHKYPRPDNLQRHVRVHHGDKDKDDPLLRDVLAQRPEGGSRGRRRRVGA